jgi:DNA-directed RNA polymerase subunit RPC12/RpoP
MAKSKNKSRSESEHLRGEIKRLKKELGRQNKRQHLYEDLEDRQEEIEYLKQQAKSRKSENKYVCPKCSGQLEVIDGSKLKVFICTECSYRASKRQ